MDDNGALNTVSVGIREEPYCFSRSSVNFQGHMVENNADLPPT